MAFPRTRKSLVSFNGGELSPKMDARNDTEKYQVGCRQFQNFLPLPHGGATRRRGFEYQATGKSNDADKPSRMLRFQFSQNDGVMIEVGNYYMRFYTRDGGPVMDPGTPTIPYEIATPYSSAQAFAIQTAQVNDVVYIAHPLFPQRKLTRLANDSWTLSPVVFDLPAFIDLNVTTTTLSVTPATVGTGRTMQASAALFDNPLHVGSYWRIGHHRDATSVELAITVNATSSSLPVLGKWTVNTYGTWAADIYIENSIDNGSTWERVRKYTSKSDSDVSDAGEQEDTEALYRVVVANWTASSGSPAPRVVFGVSDGRIFGLVKITAVTDSDTATVDVIKAVYSTAATTYWNEGAWSDKRGYPTSLAFFQQRLWFGGSAYQPQTFWGSVTDDYEDFTLGTNADSGLAFTLASEERNQILWMVGQRRLVLGTSGGVWAAYGDELEAAITATKPPLVLKQNQIPCAYQRPIFINGSILFIQSSGRKLRELVLDGAQGIYDDTDLTVLSDQISAGGLLTPCYQQDRDSLVWCTTGLGNLVSMTYEKKQNVIAWARHTTPGVFESCDTIKGDIDDEVWVCVLRTINGSPTRCIERMKGYYNPSVDPFPNIQQSFLPCATAAISGGQGYQIELVSLGTDTGTVQLDFDAYSIPDRFVVKWGSTTVIDTGYRGDSSYDAALAALGLPPVSGVGAGTAIFNKTTAYPNSATIEVYGPLPGTAWEATLGCPGGGSPPSGGSGTLTLSGTELEKAFVDSYVVYASFLATVIGGLDHLNGATVSILADGVVIPDQVVSGGTITLTTPAKIVHVGLAYESVLQPMRIDTDNQIGGSQGLVKRIHQIVFRFIDTQGPYSLSTTPGGTAVSIPLKTAVALAPFNGDAPPWDYSADYDPDATFVIRQAKPLPLTLLGAFVKYQITES